MLSSFSLISWILTAMKHALYSLLPGIQCMKSVSIRVAAREHLWNGVVVVMIVRALLFCYCCCCYNILSGRSCQTSLDQLHPGFGRSMLNVKILGERAIKNQQLFVMTASPHVNCGL